MEPMKVQETIPSKTKVITDEDVDFAYEVLRLCPKAFLGGSFVVHGRGAGDIDVVVPHVEWRALRAALSGRIMKVRRDIPTEAEDESDLLDDDRLVTVYRRGNVDLLVIKDEFIPSYQKAVAAMRRDPEAYQERDARVAVHIYYADEYRREHSLPLEEEIIRVRKANGGGAKRTGEYGS